MAFFKAKVLRQRKDGMYVVYIRVTQNRKSKYIRTSWVVDDDGLSRDKHDIIDPFVAEQTTKIISRYYNTLNRIDTQYWTVKEIVDYIQKGKDGISFSKYARKHIDKMIIMNINMVMFLIGMIGSILASILLTSIVAAIITKVAEWLK